MFLFPEKKTCFFQLSWSLSTETVEYLSLHYENWAKAGSGAGYSIQEDEKLIYISILIGLKIGLINISLIKFQILFYL